MIQRDILCNGLTPVYAQYCKSAFRRPRDGKKQKRNDTVNTKSGDRRQRDTEDGNIVSLADVQRKESEAMSGGVGVQHSHCKKGGESKTKNL